MSGTPSLEVVVIVIAGSAALQTCLAALRRGDIAQTVSIAPAQAADEELVRRFSEFVVVRAASPIVPLRRRDAARASTADVVAFLEDTTTPGEEWAATIATSFRDPRLGALGGPITISPDLRPGQRALGWAEYGAFVGAPGGRTETVPGNNMAYRRHALLAALAELEDGLIEHRVCARLLELGFDVRLAEGMAANLQAAPRRGDDLAGRFAHGRLYGATRGSGRGPWVRAALAARYPALVPWLTVRQAMQMRRARRMDWSALLAAMPDNIAWATGETVGILSGSGASWELWH